MASNDNSSDDAREQFLPITEQPASRRRFLRTSALAALAAGVACKTRNPAARSEHDEAEAAQQGAAVPPKPVDPRAMADHMDHEMEEVTKAFPAATAGKGNQPLQSRTEAGVKIFELTAAVMQWEVSKGQHVEAWAYNGQVPGPQIRVREGDRVRIVLKNDLPESTSIHFHGLELPNAQDGVPFITQPPIKPGETYTYEFVVPNAGSHMYHSHHNAAKQVSLGMLGAFVVEPRVPTAAERADSDYVLILNDGSHGFTLNGKSFPATEPLTAKRGEKLRIRFMNEGMMIHPMHLHGMHMTVIAKDGWDVPAPWRCDTLNIAPGDRWDVIVNCNNPGTWAFHCHILLHAETEHGMYGMVTALVVS